MNGNHQKETLLRIEDLTLSLVPPDPDPAVKVIDGVSLEVRRGEIVGIVGESGSGKSVTSQAVLRLLQSPPWRIDRGKILFSGRDLHALDGEEMRKLRGKEIAVIMQEPMSALNPFFTIGEQVGEVLTAHLDIGKREAREKAAITLAEVGIPGASERMEQYPHQLSGGLKQRAMIAMALALRPSLLLADEPTTALDLTIQAQIIELIKKINADLGMAVLFITHDLALVRGLAGHTVVLYAGFVVESGDTETLFDSPLHPYTRALIDVIPTPGKQQDRLRTIPGKVPRPGERPTGCPFHPRCPRKMNRCREVLPGTTNVGKGRTVRCWLHSGPEV